MNGKPLSRRGKAGFFWAFAACGVVAVPENCRSYPILGGSMPCNGIDVEVVRKPGQNNSPKTAADSPLTGVLAPAIPQVPGDGSTGFRRG